MKYYYTDPLAAAYMAREFGVAYVIKDFKWLDNACTCYNMRRENADKYYIHPDDYHIFEPQSGDMMAVDKVIQRNNKPFFWPEVQDES